MKSEGIVLLRNAAQHLRDRWESLHGPETWAEWYGDGLAIDALDGLRCVDGDELVADDAPMLRRLV